MEVGAAPPPRYEAATEDAGNGSLMRLSPVPVRYFHDTDMARTVARESSYATHPGPIAACACELLSYLIASAIADKVRNACVRLRSQLKSSSAGAASLS